MTLYPTVRTQTEHIIAVSRVALAAAAVLALWLEPASPTNYSSLTAVIQGAYLLYAIGLLGVVWWWTGAYRLALLTHSIDILVFLALQLFLRAPSSPLFVFFLFSISCAALRWGWKGTLATSGVVVPAFGLICVWMARTLSVDVDLNRMIIRVVYLLITAGTLAYLGRYEARLREEIERLARWPTTAGATLERAAQEILEHAARILDAGKAIVIWEADEEPARHLVTWSQEQGRGLHHLPPGDWPLTGDLWSRTFIAFGEITSASTLLVKGQNGDLFEHQGFPLDSAVLTTLTGSGLTSAAFRTDRLGGRCFFTDLRKPTFETIAITEVVAHEIGASLDQMQVTHQLQGIAAREERLRLARDLHDGVLQSLTGIRYELRSMADALHGSDDAVRGRLLSLERAISIEQRDLRHLIGDLKPAAASQLDSLASRLDALGERLALEWNTPVSIRVIPECPDCRAELAQAVPLMVHEAVVNAFKHAGPTRVNVAVDTDPERLRIVVSDNGRGFPFKGQYDHRALGELGRAPRSLFDRVTALGGKMSIESSDAGSRIEMVVSL